LPETADYAAKGMIRPLLFPLPSKRLSGALRGAAMTLWTRCGDANNASRDFLLFLGLPEPKETERWRRDVLNHLLALPLDPPRPSDHGEPPARADVLQE